MTAAVLTPHRASKEKARVRRKDKGKADDEEGSARGFQTPIYEEHADGSPERGPQTSGPGSEAKQHMAVKTLLQMAGTRDAEEQAFAGEDEAVESPANDSETKHKEEDSGTDAGEEEVEGRAIVTDPKAVSTEASGPANDKKATSIAMETTVELGPELKAEQAAVSEEDQTDSGETDNDSSSDSSEGDTSGEDDPPKDSLPTAQNGRVALQEETEESTDSGDEGAQMQDQEDGSSSPEQGNQDIKVIPTTQQACHPLTPSGAVFC